MNIIFRSYIYDALYIMADQLIKKYNPCQIYKDAAGEACCVRNHPCCSGCKFLGPNGCTTKCLGCKLGLCTAAADANIEQYRILTKMRYIAQRYGLSNIRTSKKEIFDWWQHRETCKSVMSNTIRYY
jgi:hypothetical protein